MPNGAGVKLRADEGNGPRSLERFRSGEPLQRAHVTAGLRAQNLSLEVYAGFPLSFNARFGPKECSIE